MKLKMAKNYISKSLKEDEKIIAQAELNAIIRIPYLLSFFIVLFILFKLPIFENARLWLLLLAVDICLFIDTFKICVLLDTTELCFTNMRVIGKIGLLKTKSLDAPMNKINDIEITQNLFGKIFRYSKIVISTSSNKYDFKYIKDAEKFKNEMTDYINSFENKNKKDIVKEDNYDKLKKLKFLLDENIISQEEFEKEKKKLLQ